jgi:SAM-dependent methyltransferase
VVTEELRRRAAGEVVSLDLTPQPGATLAGDATHLPFPDASFDLVFFQNVLLWVGDLPAAVTEAARVLQPGGDLVALEPDYGGMMEQPDLGLAALWRDALTRAGADPLVGRRLPGACEAAGLQVWVELTHLPQPAHADALRLLERHELTGEERRRLEAARRALESGRGEWGVFLHVPYFAVVAEKR